MASWEDDEVNPFLLTAASPNINERAARNSAAASLVKSTGSNPSRGRVPQAGRIPNVGRNIGAGRGRGPGSGGPQPTGRKSEGPLTRRAPKQRASKASSSTAAAPVSVEPQLQQDLISSFEDTRLKLEADAGVVYRRHHTDSSAQDSSLSTQARALKTLRGLSAALVDLGVVDLVQRRAAISHVLGNDEHASVDEAFFVQWWATNGAHFLQPFPSQAHQNAPVHPLGAVGLNQQQQQQQHRREHQEQLPAEATAAGSRTLSGSQSSEGVTRALPQRKPSFTAGGALRSLRRSLSFTKRSSGDGSESNDAVSDLLAEGSEFVEANDDGEKEGGTTTGSSNQDKEDKAGGRSSSEAHIEGSSANSLIDPESPSSPSSTSSNGTNSKLQRRGLSPTLSVDTGKGKNASPSAAPLNARVEVGDNGASVTSNAATGRLDKDEPGTPLSANKTHEDPYLLLGQLAAVRSELERMSFRESPSAAGTNATSNLSSTLEDDDDEEDKEDEENDGSITNNDKENGVRPREVSSTLWWDEDKGASWLRERQAAELRETLAEVEQQLNDYRGTAEAWQHWSASCDTSAEELSAVHASLVVSLSPRLLKAASRVQTALGGMSGDSSHNNNSSTSSSTASYGGSSSTSATPAPPRDLEPNTPLSPFSPWVGGASPWDSIGAAFGQNAATGPSQEAQEACSELEDLIDGAEALTAGALTRLEQTASDLDLVLAAIRGEDDDHRGSASSSFHHRGLPETIAAEAAELADAGTAGEAEGRPGEGSVRAEEVDSNDWSDGGARVLATKFARLESVWQAALRRPGGATGMHAREVAKATAVFAEGLLVLHEPFLDASKCLSDQATRLNEIASKPQPEVATLEAEKQKIELELSAISEPSESVFDETETKDSVLAQATCRRDHALRPYTSPSDDLSCGACHDTLATGCPFRGCKRCVFLLCLSCCRERATQAAQSPSSSSSSSASTSEDTPAPGTTEKAAPMQEVSQGLDELLALIGLPSLFGTQQSNAPQPQPPAASDAGPSGDASEPSAETSPPLSSSESGNFFDGMSTSLFGSPLSTNTSTEAAATAARPAGSANSKTTSTTSNTTKTPTSSRSRGAQPRTGRSASPRAHPLHPAKRTPVSARRSTITGSMPSFSFGLGSAKDATAAPSAEGADSKNGENDNVGGDGDNDGDGSGDGSAFTSPFGSSIGSSLGAIGNFFSPTSASSSSSSSSSSARRASRTLQPLARSPRAGSPRASTSGSGAAAPGGGVLGPGRRGKGGRATGGGGGGSLRPSSSFAERKQEDQAHAKEVSELKRLMGKPKLTPNETQRAQFLMRRNSISAAAAAPPPAPSHPSNRSKHDSASTTASQSSGPLRHHNGTSAKTVPASKPLHSNATTTASSKSSSAPISRRITTSPRAGGGGGGGEGGGLELPGGSRTLTKGGRPTPHHTNGPGSLLRRGSSGREKSNTNNTNTKSNGNHSRNRGTHATAALQRGGSGRESNSLCGKDLLAPRTNAFNSNTTGRGEDHAGSDSDSGSENDQSEGVASPSPVVEGSAAMGFDYLEELISGAAGASSPIETSAN